MVGGSNSYEIIRLTGILLYDLLFLNGENVNTSG